MEMLTEPPRLRAWQMSCLGLGQSVHPAALRVDIELEPVRHAQLVVDAAQVVAQRVLAYLQAPGNRVVVRARVEHDMAHDVALSRGQRPEPGLASILRR